MFSQWVVSDWATLWTVALQAPLPLEFPSKNIGVECHFFLQGILLTQGLNLHLLCLLLWHVNSATWEIFKDITNAELWQSPYIPLGFPSPSWSRHFLSSIYQWIYFKNFPWSDVEMSKIIWMGCPYSITSFFRKQLSLYVFWKDAKIKVQNFKYIVHPLGIFSI